MGGHRVRGFAAYERREINSVSYGQENKNSVSPCLLFSIIVYYLIVIHLHKHSTSKCGLRPKYH